MGTMTEEEFANLSDDEIMGFLVPPSLAQAEPESANGEEQDAEEIQRTDETSAEDAAEAGTEDLADERNQELEGDSTTTAAEADASNGDDDDDDDRSDEELAKGPPVKTSPETKKSETEKSEVTAKAPAEIPAGDTDYKTFYEKMMAPFKANGKEIKLESPEEAIRLMQMGANYTKKLQSLQPNLKLMRMLEDAKLLDESKLSFLIDLENKNPEAIAKLLKDGKIDPLDLDTRSEKAYTPKSYAVSDQEHSFRNVLDEVVSTQEGKAVVTLINQTWDAVSKQRIWDDPAILQVMVEHKQNGAYDQISQEVVRRQTVGTLSTSVPFIQAYQQVGMELAQRVQQSTAQTPNGNPAGNQTPKTTDQANPAANQKKVLDVRAATSKKTTASVDPRVKAAMPSRSGATTSKASDFDPMQLSDEEFLKLAPLKGRL